MVSEKELDYGITHHSIMTEQSLKLLINVSILV